MAGNLPLGYRIVSGGSFRRPNGKYETLLLQRWESTISGPFWNRALDFAWHTISKEEYYGWNESARKEADLRLRVTARLEEQTRAIELRWTDRPSMISRLLAGYNQAGSRSEPLGLKDD